MVTEEELATLLHAHGWYLKVIPRYQTKYFYAQRREGKSVVTRYLKTERLLDKLTTDEVLKRIQQDKKEDS